MSDTPELRFFTEEGQKVDLPHLSWILKNRPKFRRRMPLTQFLHLLPGWLLREAADSASALERGQSTKDPLKETAATFLALEHLRMWSRDPQDRLELTVEKLAEIVIEFNVACSLELHRRVGLLRVHVTGDDRLGGDPTMSLELNPIVMDALVRRGMSSDFGSADVQRLLAEVMPQTLASTWAEPEHLED